MDLQISRSDCDLMQSWLTVICEAHRRPVQAEEHPAESSAGGDRLADAGGGSADAPRNDGSHDYIRLPTARITESSHNDNSFVDFESLKDYLDDDDDDLFDDHDYEGGRVISDFSEAYRNANFGGVPASAVAVANIIEPSHNNDSLVDFDSLEDYLDNNDDVSLDDYEGGGVIFEFSEAHRNGGFGGISASAVAVASITEPSHNDDSLVDFDSLESYLNDDDDDLLDDHDYDYYKGGGVVIFEFGEAYRNSGFGGIPAFAVAVTSITEPSHNDDSLVDFDPLEDYLDDNNDDSLDSRDYHDYEGGGVIFEFGEAYRNSGFGGIPASTVAVANIKRQKYYEESGDESCGMGEFTTAGCIICIEDFEVSDDLTVMPCSHRFHEVCLVEWLVHNRLCPYCRYALPNKVQHQHSQGTMF